MGSRALKGKRPLRASIAMAKKNRSGKAVEIRGQHEDKFAANAVGFAEIPDGNA
jgi:hypothetical protein